MGWLDKIMGRQPAPEPFGEMTQAQANDLSKKLIAAKTEHEVDAVAHEVLAIARGAPVRDGIHHEFFLDDEPVNGRYGWLCRVYARGGVMHQTSGSEETNAAATQAAIDWAESKKAELRRVA